MSNRKLIDGAKELHEKTRSAYTLFESQLAEELERVRVVLAALGARVPAKQQDETASIPLAGALPPIYMIREYLKECGKPASQGDIVRAVGERRAAKYPHLSRPYGDVWKSLEYHDRHNRDVVCVKHEGDLIVPTKLISKPRHPRVKGGAGDHPEFYEGPNLFYFKPAE
jgi:hypothetical protein